MITRFLFRLFRQVFGWGTYLIPLVFGAIGVLLLRRHKEDSLPIHFLRTIGGVLLTFIALLALTHVILYTSKPVISAYINPALADPAYPGYTPNLIWEEAAACPTNSQALIDQGWVSHTMWVDNVYDLAKCGHGGGYIGAFFVSVTNEILGLIGTYVISIAMLAGGIMITTRTKNQ
jgi:hypothetical protein